MVGWLFVCLFAYKRGGVWQVSQGSTVQLAANKAKWDRGTGTAPDTSRACREMMTDVVTDPVQ